MEIKISTTIIVSNSTNPEMLANGNAHEAQRIFDKRNLNRMIPSFKSILKLYSKWTETGRFENTYEFSGGPAKVTTSFILCWEDRLATRCKSKSCSKTFAAAIPVLYSTHPKPITAGFLTMFIFLTGIRRRSGRGQPFFIQYFI